MRQQIRQVGITSIIITNLIISTKVSAAHLHHQEALIPLLKHCKLNPQDKITWDKAYTQEYNGLTNMDT